MIKITPRTPQKKPNSINAPINNNIPVKPKIEGRVQPCPFLFIMVVVKLYKYINLMEKLEWTKN